MEKVLIVDDEPTIQQLIARALSKYVNKFETIHAYDGEEAIEILSQRYISLLVTDIVMPKVDGLQLLTYMNNNYPQIPCIVMTGHRFTELKKKLQDDNIFRFFSKPFHIDALGQAILQALDQDVPGGVLKGISVASFLQMIELEGKTCLFEVRSPGNSKGVFYFQEGTLFDAAFGKMKGEEAAIQMIWMEKAEISFKRAPMGRVQKNIMKPLTGLIMEAMQRKDEECSKHSQPENN
jgi:CheY-like chemotaxis protein